VAPAGKKDEAGRALVAAGNLLVTRLAVPIPSAPTLRMVAYNDEEDWTISRRPYTRETQWSGAQHASPGHAAELSFLLSRAVERGFPPGWLSTAQGLLDGVVKYADDPATGALVYETIGYDMKPLPGNPDNALYIYWAQAENLRALMHWSLVRDPSYRPAFLKAQKFVTEVLADREFGDWYQEIDAVTLQATRMEKGDNWKGDYHEAMLGAEALRLGMPRP
jgi:mannose/cellobiose epimerase-like protein (N-acyl-D-glucosamine 2-epimerase family)